MAKPICAHTNDDDWSSRTSASRWRKKWRRLRNQYTLTKKSTIGRQENWNQDRGLPIVKPRALDRAANCASIAISALDIASPALPSTSWPSGNKGVADIRAALWNSISSYPFPTLTPWKHLTSQTHGPPIQLWKISWYRWASGGLVVVDMESGGCKNFEQFICV